MSLGERAGRIRNHAQMLWKRCLSYRKREWVLSDYPVLVHEQTGVPANSRYFARILGWNIDGLGATREDALRQMEHWYETRKDALKSEGKPVPRPGTPVPIRFASQERVIAQSELVKDFIRRVLGLEWAFLTDESSLYHFYFDGHIDPLLDRVKELYGVDVSDIVDGNIAEILERISAQRSQ
jgi:hypothetical protein